LKENWLTEEQVTTKISRFCGGAEEKKYGNNQLGRLILVKFRTAYLPFTTQVLLIVGSVK